MKQNAQNVYWRVMSRDGLAAFVIVPIVAIYMRSLMSLNYEDTKIIIKLIAIVTPILFFLHSVFMWIHLTPLLNALRKLENEETPNEEEVFRAERCALYFPYYICWYSILWFSIAGILVSWWMMHFAGLRIDKTIFGFLGCSTGGVACGLIVFYYVRPVLLHAIETILRAGGKLREKQPLFVPIYMKLIISIGTIVFLMVVYLSIYSFVTISQVSVDQERNKQKEMTFLIASTVGNFTQNEDQIIEYLTKISSPEKLYCLVDIQSQFKYCASDSPSIEVINQLSKEGVSIFDKATSREWLSANIAQNNFKILSGWKIEKIKILSASFWLRYVVITVVTVLMGFGLSLFIAVDISTPLKRLCKVALEIADGDMNPKLIVGNEDETGKLARAFSKMTGMILSQLNEEVGKSKAMVLSIRDAVNALAPMSNELVSIAGEQATGSIEQATAAEEAAITSQEIVAVSKSIAQHATEVASIAENSLNLTQQGQDRLNLTMSKFGDIDRKMEDIADSIMKLGEQSKEIGEIVEIIDEISEQTNLLALNASIEAAGAGEQGQRFGVVAQEIRRMAQGTAQSTKRIREIIERMRKSLSSSVMIAEEGEKAVTSGQKVMEELAKVLSEIFESSQNAAPRLKEIGLMTSQQSSASEQMAKTVEEVRETAHQSSASAGEMQTSIKELETIVEQLAAHIKGDLPDMIKAID